MLRIVACLVLAEVLTGPLNAQPAVIRQLQQRASRYTTGQPHWVGAVFTTVPMLVQVLREDVVHQEITGGHVWNVGVNKGLQVVPLPRLEFTVAVPPYMDRDFGQTNGFGDFFTSAKVRIAARPEGKGNYILSGLVNSTVPTGTYRNGAPDATVAPQLVGGKGWGRFDQVLSLTATLPVQHTDTNGRVLTENTATQYHLTKFFWPEVETSTTTWFGSARDGQVQFLLGPSFIVGRVPYRKNELDRRRGFSIGAGYLVAVTHTRATNHLFQITTRFHF